MKWVHLIHAWSVVREHRRLILIILKSLLLLDDEGAAVDKSVSMEEKEHWAADRWVGLGHCVEKYELFDH